MTGIKQLMTPAVIDDAIAFYEAERADVDAKVEAMVQSAITTGSLKKSDCINPDAQRRLNDVKARLRAAFMRKIDAHLAIHREAQRGLRMNEGNL
jgi:hypothetical protein